MTRRRGVWSLAGDFIDRGSRDWGFSRSTIAFIAAGPAAIVLAGLGSALLGKNAYKWFTGEDGVAETLQVFCYAIALGLATTVARRLWRGSNRLLTIMYVGVCGGLFFMVGEELSWGQRIFGWVTPGELAEINKQAETNLHNIYGVGSTFKWIQMLVGAYGALLPIVLYRLKIGSSLREFASFVIPPGTVALFFAPMLFWRLFRNLFEAPDGFRFAIAEFNEVVELVLACGFLLFMLFQYRRLRPGSQTQGADPEVDSLRSVVESGTWLWLDSIDPELVRRARQQGATGATSNPIIVADIIATGQCDDRITDLVRQELDDEEIAWTLTDELVRSAQRVFRPIWEETRGDDGYVSFELDPLLEDKELGLPHDERVARYVELGRRWSRNEPNRMIKVPATAAGLEALDGLAEAGIPLNVTLIFTARQYRTAREAVWRGARRRGRLDALKSVYSIFVSRVDVYTERHVPELSRRAQGLVGIVNAKQIWAENQRFWADKALPLHQQIVFASTGAKRAGEPPDKYVAAFCGGDIQTNPPATNDWVAQSGRIYRPRLREFPATEIGDEIRAKVDMKRLEEVLMAEGIAKFADPHRELLARLADRRRTLSRT